MAGVKEVYQNEMEKADEARELAMWLEMWIRDDEIAHWLTNREILFALGVIGMLKKHALRLEENREKGDA